MSKKISEKNKHKVLKENQKFKGFKEKLQFPKFICLENCDTKVNKGYEKDIIETLKAFSEENLYNQKMPHNLSKSKNTADIFKKAKNCCGAEKVISLDVRSRKDKYRLFYCEIDGVCKILDLCSDKSHKG